jgi:hypothetical protein
MGRTKGKFCHAMGQMGNFGSSKYFGELGTEKYLQVLKIHGHQSWMEADYQ